jgi:hypothetical protein
MKNPRTLAQLRSHPWVESVEQEEEDNGYWLNLKTGYWSPDTEAGSLHEFTISDLCAAFISVETWPAWMAEGKNRPTFNF